MLCLKERRMMSSEMLIHVQPTCGKDTPMKRICTWCVDRIREILYHLVIQLIQIQSSIILMNIKCGIDLFHLAFFASMKKASAGNVLVTPAVNLKVAWSLFTAGTLISASIIQTMSSFALIPVICLILLGSA